MNKKQVIKQYFLLLCPLLLVAVGVFSIVALTSRNSHNDNETEGTSKNCTESANKSSESDEMIQILKDARIESENMRLWNRVLHYKDYNETINMEHIRGTEITKLYKGPTFTDNKNAVAYYFQKGRVDNGYYYHGFDCVTYSMEDQSLSSGGSSFESRFLDDVQEELDKRGAEYLGYITIEYPAPYFPTPHMTERKQTVIDALKGEIKSFIIGHIEHAEDYGNDLGLEPGKYPVYILDFMDSDQRTTWMLYDKKRQQYVASIMEFSGGPEYCHPQSPHLFMNDDEDRGGIMYSELFIKLSICNFTVVIE